MLWGSLTLSQQLLTSLHGSCVQHCKLDKLCANYYLEVISAYSYQGRHLVQTFIITHNKNKDIPCSYGKNSLWTSAIAPMFAVSPTVTSAATSMDVAFCEKVNTHDVTNYSSIKTESTTVHKHWMWSVQCMTAAAPGYKTISDVGCKVYAPNWQCITRQISDLSHAWLKNSFLRRGQF